MADVGNVMDTIAEIEFLKQDITVNADLIALPFLDRPEREKHNIHACFKQAGLSQAKRLLLMLAEEETLFAASEKGGAYVCDVGPADSAVDTHRFSHSLDSYD